jgi:phosphoglycerol transferase MdoB-like AlkP superfamily enzyme
MFFFGLRFDLSAVCYSNLLLIATYLVPFSFRHNLKYQFFQKILFFIAFIFTVGAEITDIAYFKFNQRRSLVSDLILLKNTAAMIPQFLKEYWYLLFLGVFIFLIINKLYDFFTLKKVENQTLLSQIMLFIIGLGCTIVATRGGLQLRPITPIDAAKYVSEGRFTPLVSNTTLNFIASYETREISVPQYFSESELDNRLKIQQQFSKDSTFRPLNVVVIALEGFGKEFMTHYNDYQGFTPFLDSLVSESLTCKYSFANAQRSAGGIVSITASVPQLMDEPLMFSPYMSNNIDGLAVHLRKKGYQTGFFHGCNPGSMEFEQFAHLSGFEHFYDRTAFPNQSEYDGQWGIWDQPFLQYFANQLTAFKEPFYGFTFTLTSHHPFNVPSYFEKKYPNEDKLVRSFRYADDALRQFFATAATKPWFNRTLFVLSADHIGLINPEHPQYYSQNGRFKIPILFYYPNGKLKGENNAVCQQIDIMPSVLDYLHYDLPFSAFGRSIFGNEANHYFYGYSDNIYQISDGKFSLLYDGKEIQDLYDLNQNPEMNKNVNDQYPEMKQLFLEKLKAYIQRYNQSMVKNGLVK